MLKEVLTPKTKLSGEEIYEIVNEKLLEKGGTITAICKEISESLNIPFQKIRNGYNNYKGRKASVKVSPKTMNYTSELHKAYKCFFQGEAYEVHVDCNTNEPKIVKKL